MLRSVLHAQIALTGDTDDWDASARDEADAAEAGASTSHLYECPDGLPVELYGENLLVSAPDIHGALGDLLRDADAGRPLAP